MTLAFSFIRIFIFKMPESPRYLLSKARDAEAVDAVNYVARKNGKAEPLTLDMLEDIDIQLGLTINRDEGTAGLSHMEIMKGNVKDFKGVEYSKLFANKKLGLHTGLIWLIWLMIGKCQPFRYRGVFLTGNYRDCIPPLLQFPSIVPRTKVYSTFIFIPHIPELLH